MKRSEREYIKRLSRMLDECDGGGCGGGCGGDCGAMSAGAGEYCSLGEPGTGGDDVLGRCDHGGSKGFMGDGCFHVPFPTMPRLVRIPGNGGSLSKKKKNGRTVSVKNPYVKGMKTIVAETEPYNYVGSAKKEFDMIAKEQDNVYMGVLNYNKAWRLAWMIDSDGYQRVFKPIFNGDDHEYGLHDNLWHIVTARLMPNGETDYLNNSKTGYATEEDALGAIYNAVQQHKELLNEFLRRMDESRFNPRDLVRWEASGRDPRYFPQPRKPCVNQRALQAELKRKFYNQFDSAEVEETPAGTWRATFYVSRPGEGWREIRGQVRARQAIPMINQVMSFLRTRDVNVNQYDVKVVNAADDLRESDETGGIASVDPYAAPEEVFDELSDQELEDYCKDLEFLLHANDKKAKALYNKFRQAFKDEFGSIKCKKGFVGIKDLHPTQNVIFLKKSIGPMLDGSWKDRRHGGQPVVKSLLDPSDSRQITMGFLVVCSVNGVNYLIDGHHRWSKAYMINPDAKLFAYVIPSEGLFKNEDDVLKFAHGEIALYLGRNNDDNHPVNKKANKANDINIYDADDRTIKAMVMKYLTDEVVKIFANKKNILGGKTNRKQEIAEYIAGNKDVMVENAPKGEHSRVFMPQYPEDHGPGEAVGSLRESKIVKSALHWQRLLG